MALLFRVTALPHRFLCAVTAALASAGSMAQTLPVMELRAGPHRIQAEVAATYADRQQGLMYRTQMRSQQGMLFVFEEKAGHCFWMKNTPLPLSIAFLADDGSIVNIEDMQPKTETNHCPKTAVRFALEMNQGWFKQRGLKPGSRIEGLPQY